MELIYSINHETNVIKNGNEIFTLSGELLKGKVKDVKFFNYNTESWETRKLWDLESKDTKYFMKYIGKVWDNESVMNRKNWKKEIKAWMK